jgi:hypothetical protein
MLEWYVVRCGSNYWHQEDMCLEEVGVHSNFPDITFLTIKVHVIFINLGGLQC